MRALDLFAGTGWGVACHWLGIEEFGVEIMPEAVATREANGMKTIFRDVWDGLLRPEKILFLAEAMAKGLTFADLYDILIASPPCQTFSMAGKGAGRQALDEVIQAITDHLYKDPAELIRFGEEHDPRTALVLAPLAYIWRDKPRYVVLEQVPTVQPVWEAYADVMRGWGYSVETAVLNAEQYGVPQTRRRSILVAHLNGPVALPTPTHSKYYSRNPTKLDEGVLPWISMAEALGWGRKDAPVHTITAGSVEHGPTDRWASGGASVRKRMDDQVGGPNWFPREGDVVAQDPRSTHDNRFETEDVAAIQTYPRILQSGNQVNATKRAEDLPAPTICFGKNAARIEWVSPEQAATTSRSGIQVTPEEAATLQSYPAGLVGFPRLSDGKEEIELDGKAYRARDLRDADLPSQVVTEKARSWKHYTQDGQEVITPEEAATLQSYPADLVLRNGNQANATQRTPDQPAPTVMFGQRVNKVEWMPQDLAQDPAASGVRITQEEASTLQSYPSHLAPAGTSSQMVDPRPVTAPAHTITGAATAEWGERPTRAPGPNSRDPLARQVTPEEAAALQSYPKAIKSMGAGMVERHGERPGREADQPAFTIRASAGGTEPGGFKLEQDGETRKLEPAEAAALQSYPEALRPEWASVRPATTIMGDSRIAAAGHHENQMKGAYKATVEETATLQTYPQVQPFVWCGTKSKVFLQIGNAVPPVLAAAVLAAVVSAR